MHTHTVRPYEFDGEFYPGFIQKAGTTNRNGRRRILCFVTRSGVVGASPSFSKSAAVANAKIAEGFSTRDPRLNRAAMSLPEPLTTLLKSRGFPVHNSYDGVDERTAEHLSDEINFLQTR